jgi:hypothetical protein
MQITLGNVAVAVTVALGCGTVIRSIGTSLKRGFVMAEEAVSFVRWLKPLMQKYPDSAIVVEKLAKLNGHKDTESTVTTTEHTTNFK